MNEVRQLFHDQFRVFLEGQRTTFIVGGVSLQSRDGQPIIYNTGGSRHETDWIRVSRTSPDGKRVMQAIAAYLAARWTK